MRRKKWRDKEEAKEQGGFGQAQWLGMTASYTLSLGVRVMYVDVAQAEYGGVCWQQHTNVIACGNYFSLYIFSSPFCFHFFI